MTQSSQAAPGKVDKAQPRRAQRLDQAQNIRCRHQDRRQVRLRGGLRRPHHRGSRRRAGHVLQSFREPPGTARSIAAEDRHRHGALHPRAHRHRACAQAGNRTLQRLLRVHPRGAGISAHPQRGRIFAPIGYQKHLDNISTAYVRILRRARLAGAIVDFSDEEFEAIVHMFMGARGYLSRRYSYAGGKVTAVPDHVISAYQKLVTRGLFTPDKGNGHDR